MTIFYQKGRFESVISEQNYEISSPLSSFSVDFLKEYNNKTSSNNEFEYEVFNKTFNDNINNIYFEDFEENQNKIIDNLKHTKFILCVVTILLRVKLKSTKLR